MGRKGPPRLASLPISSVAMRLITLQLVVFAAVIVTFRGGPVTIVLTGCATAVALVIVLLPWRSRTAWRWLTVRVTFVCRRRHDSRFETTPVAMRVLNGALLHEVPGRGDERVGALQRQSRWTSVCAVAPSGPGRLDGADRMLSPAVLWSALSVPTSAAASLRIVVHRMVGLEGTTRWRTWVCLGLDAAILGDAIAGRGGGRTGMARTLTAETSRMCIDALRIGVHLEPLDAAGVAVAVHESLGVPTTAGTDGPGMQETWDGCMIVGLTHRTYQQSTWSGAQSLMAVLGPGVLPSAASLTLSATVDQPGNGLPRMRALLRIAARPDAWATSELADLRAGMGVWLPLNGLQLPGVLATVPLGPSR